MSKREIKFFTDKELYHHQACPTRAPEGSTKHGKEQVPATAKIYQIVKTMNTMKKLSTYGQNNQLASKWQDQIHI